MKVLAIGASRNIGYHASLELLKAGNTVIFQLRNVSAFDDDAEMQPFIKSGQAKLIKGDALVQDDARTTWTEANADGVPVEVVLLTVGGAAKFTLTKGFVINPPNLCTSALLNILTVIPHDVATQPKIVAVTSNGVKADSHKSIPFLAKGFYALISVPHADKLGMERVFHWSAGWPEEEWKEGDPEAHILPQGWEETLGGKPGWLKSFVVVRPAILTDGEQTDKYKVGEDIPGLWTVSRKDVGHFIASDVLKDWSKWEGKAVSVGYT
ncbi:hypothetical protein M407DRAFT_76466 [Tulasnella calospora MUT 4182]|uniref:NAD(P)-binding domain-containing protein n=1 Tax=Tulasnella calospora MUT 4182 TaxID=1051891 RepID=A0A0C3QFE4_9AGAM|nr:hypothetical protein M407DRAFT_76466 [Tulasnella calospora MUT 4182]